MAVEIQKAHTIWCYEFSAFEQRCIPFRIRTHFTNVSTINYSLIDRIIIVQHSGKTSKYIIEINLKSHNEYVYINKLPYSVNVWKKDLKF